MAGLDLTADRASVEELMADTCLVTRDPELARVDEEDFDPITGTYPDSTLPATVYNGPALIGADNFTGDAAFAEQKTAPVDDPSYRALVPVSAPAFKEGYRLLVTAIGPYSDPQLLGLRFRVSGNAKRSTFAVVRRVPLEIV